MSRQTRKDKKQKEDEEFWEKRTGPFFTDDETGTQPALLRLCQVRNDEFRLLTAFRFVDRDGRPISVTGEDLGRTDLASIPGYLGWFARRHGRHTFAALMHDQLIRDSTPHADRVAADLHFRHALLRSNVPPVRAWLLWTAVALGTRLRLRWHGLAGMVAWFAAALAGNTLLIAGLWTTTPWLVLVALLAPVPSAWLWGHQWRAGLVAGYASWFAIAGSLPAWSAFQAYRGAEWVAIRLARPREETKEPTPVPSYSER